MTDYRTPPDRLNSVLFWAAVLVCILAGLWGLLA